MSWRSFVFDAMRVPPDPEPPPGSPPRVFRAAPNYFYLLLGRWAAGAVAFTVLAVVLTSMAAMVGASAKPAALILLGVIAVGLWVLVGVQVVFGYVIVRLEWELRWYMVSDRAIRIREGIWSVKEKTIALANIQNISVSQGPLERLLGISNVEVRTAGGGGAGPGGGAHGGNEGVGEPMHVGFFRGVDNAEEIRDIVREGVRRYRDSGLGDRDESHEAVPVASQTAVEAASTLLQEARLLRETLASAKN